MKKNSKYMTRALKSRDPRFARVLGKLGYDRMDMNAESSEQQDDASQQQQDQVVSVVSDDQEEDLTSLRAKYKEVVGKQPYYGWDAETLRQRIRENS